MAGGVVISWQKTASSRIDVYIRVRGADPVIVEYFLCDGLAHDTSFRTVL
jgi:hypothetical protein